MSQIKDSIPGPQGFTGIQGPLSMPVTIDGRDGEDSFIPGPSAPSGGAGAGLIWLDVPYNPADFMLDWSAAIGDIQIFRYAISGKTMFLQLRVFGGVTANNGNGWCFGIKLPAGAVPYEDPGSGKAGMSLGSCNITGGWFGAGQTYLCQITPISVFGLETNLIYIQIFVPNDIGHFAGGELVYFYSNLFLEIL